jgi:hypothetical protein
VDWPTVVNLAIALTALAISLAAFRSGIRQQRSAAFTRTQEFLLDADLQAARAAVYQADTSGTIPETDLAQVMRAFATFDTVAGMARRGAVNRDWILDEWHHHLRRMRHPFELALTQRARWHDFNPWCDLDDLIRDAETYATTRACCIGPTLSERTQSPPPQATNHPISGS